MNVTMSSAILFIYLYVPVPVPPCHSYIVGPILRIKWTAAGLNSRYCYRSKQYHYIVMNVLSVSCHVIYIGLRYM